MPLVAALVGAVAISFSAVWFALANVGAVTGAFFRAGYALPVLFVLWWRVRDRDHRSRPARWLAGASGLMLGGDFIAWHLSIEQIGTGLATLLANSQVVVVAILAWLLLGEKPKSVVMAAIPVLLVGVALVSGLGREGSFGSDPLLGTIYGLASAVFYAAFLLAYRRSNQVQAPAAGSLLDATAGALIAAGLAGPILGSLDVVPSWPAHGWLVGLALGSQVIGWLLIGYALPRLPAAETSTFILIQPVLTMVWGALLFDERPSLLQLGGAALVLAGVGMVALVTSRRQPIAVAATP
ncbi:MAG TPA: DMT family transporter [Acidimicrobiia bacterium]|nr:DMT family transporter [Acidimicrobiia bacterium]